MNIDFTFVDKHYACKTYEQMKSVLMDAEAASPAIFYHMIRGTKDSGNVTIIEPGTVGGEFIKTVGHYHIGNLNETYYIKNGSGIALLQKLAVDSNGKPIVDIVEEFKAIKFEEGDEVFMPGDGWGHVISNISEKYLVTIDDTVVYFDEKLKPKDGNYAEYEMVQKMQGFAFYVVEKNGKIVLKGNHKYKEIRKIEADGLQII